MTIVLGILLALGITVVLSALAVLVGGAVVWFYYGVVYAPAMRLMALLRRWLERSY
jgi:hypothetical protein